MSWYNSDLFSSKLSGRYQYVEYYSRNSVRKQIESEVPHGSILDLLLSLIYKSLHWRHNDHDGVSNHQPHGCLLNRLFRRRSKKTSKLRVTGLKLLHDPDSKIHGANMGPTWVLSAPDGPHVGPMNLAIWGIYPRKYVGPCMLKSVSCFLKHCPCRHAVRTFEKNDTIVRKRQVKALIS